MNFTETSEYRRLQCTECAVVYFFPEKWCRKAGQKGKGWECPNGHGQWFGESENDKLRRERDRLKQNLARAEDESCAHLELAQQHERQASAYKVRRPSFATAPALECAHAAGEHFKISRVTWPSNIRNSHQNQTSPASRSSRAARSDLREVRR